MRKLGIQNEAPIPHFGALFGDDVRNFEHECIDFTDKPAVVESNERWDLELKCYTKRPTAGIGN
jgi:hypothetical protein